MSRTGLRCFALLGTLLGAVTGADRPTGSGTACRSAAPFHHYVIGANGSVDRRQRWFGYGFSTMLGPEGTVIATAKSLYGSEIFTSTIKTAWTGE